MIQKIRQYIIDSYNGLYKIVLKPSMPTKATIILLVVGLLLGMLSAYLVYPVVFYNAAPNQLSQGYRDQWVKMVAASYQSGTYSDQDVIDLLTYVQDPVGTVNRLLQNATGTEQRNLKEIQGLAQAASPGTTAPRPGTLLGDIGAIIVPLILVIIITPILVLIWRLLFYPNIVAPIWDKLRPKSKEELARREQMAVEKQARLAAIEAQKKMDVVVDAQLGEPVIQKLSVYTKGRQYDDSFAIEDENDMFLGECGASIAKTLGDNDLAAVEVWLFDKEDFVRTLTKIFASEHAYNDPAIRAELEPRVENPATDIVMVRPGAQLILETDALRLQASVTTSTYATAPGLPPNSAFDAINVEIAVWQKQGVASGAPAAAPMAVPATPAPNYSPPPMQPSPGYSPQPAAPSYPSQATQPTMPPPYTPPPAQQQPQAAPPLGGSPPPLRPLTPPPSSPSRFENFDDDEDDPFGGTGDFTPLSNP